MREIRQDFQGVRWRGNGWPRELQTLHCDLCKSWHTDFRFERLHPLLHLLEDNNTFFRGHGDKLLVVLSIVSSGIAAFACWEDSSRSAIVTARHLAKAHRALEAGGVSNDIFMSPPVTKLIDNDVSCLEDTTGLKLAVVVPYMIRLFRKHLHRWRKFCHNVAIRGARQGSITEMESAPTFPTNEDWERHVATFPKITAMWEESLSDIDTIMSGVPFWGSVLAEEVKVKGADEVSI